MKKDTVVDLKKPEVIVEDPLMEVLRRGAREMLQRALEAEVEEVIALFDKVRDSTGRRLVTRNGYKKERTIQTGIGDIPVKAPRVADRRKDESKIRFTSSILPPYLRRTKSIEDLLPWLYLKGISTGDFSEALAALLGKDAPGLSASTISRLKDAWSGELKEWHQRSLRGKEYVYLWVDGVHFGARMEDASQCMLVVIGATKHGAKCWRRCKSAVNRVKRGSSGCRGNLQEEALDVLPGLLRTELFLGRLSLALSLTFLQFSMLHRLSMSERVSIDR